MPPSGRSQKLRKSLRVRSCVAASSRWLARPSTRVEDLDRLVDLRLADDRAAARSARRCRRRPRAAGRCSRARATTCAGVAVDDQPLQAGPPARAARLGPPPLGEAQQRRAEVTRRPRGSARAGPSSSIALLHVQRRGGRERVAAERRRVRARLEAARDLLVGQHRADRHAARQPLGQRHDVGDDALRSRTRRTCRCGRRRSGPRRRSAPCPCRCRARRSSCR